MMNQNPYLHLLRVAWKYAKGKRLRYLLIYFLFISSSGFLALAPLLYGWFVNKLQTDSSAVLHHTLIYVGCYVALEVLRWLCHGPARIMEQVLSFEISKNYLDELYSKLMLLPMAWHRQHHSGATVNRLRKGYVALRSFFSNGFMYIATFSQFILSLTAMVFFSPLFGAIAVSIGLFTIWISFRFDQSCIRSLNESNEKEHVVNAKLSDGLSKIVSVLTLRLEDAFKSELLMNIKDLLVPFKKAAVINEWKWFSASMMVALIYCVMFSGYVLTHITPGQTFQLGGLVALLGFVNQFTNAFSSVAANYTQILQYYTDIQTAKYIQDSHAALITPKGTSLIDPSWQKIEIRNLNFAYKSDNVKEFILNSSDQSPLPKANRVGGVIGIDMDFTKGQRIALIGESGSGKSTIMSLIRGMYQPQQVQLRVDQKPIDDWRAICETVTLLPQQPELFENTVLYNVTLGLPFAESEVEQACRVAHVLDFVDSLPAGFETLVAENGGTLSGGQRQRIALARGILAASTSSIILLDEPTSSVDEQLEADIYKELLRIFSKKLVVATFHNSLLLKNFDYVYVLRQGKLVWQGNPDHTNVEWNRANYLGMPQANSMPI